MSVNSMLLDPDLLHSTPQLHHVHRSTPNKNKHSERNLGSQDDYQSFLVDSHGNEYDPYSLAWRYLGLYMDCDPNNIQESNSRSGSRDDDRRELHSNDDEGGKCARKVLWAAYVDPRYKGNTIEEYQFYDLNTKEWDDSACQASGKRHRCVRMNCHEPRSHWKLVGVFKETDGLYDFTEQLFKHEGYCVWGDDDCEDTYETMETWMEKWPTECTQLNNQDYYGNTQYLDIQPLPGGNMTLGIYTDDKCSQISPYEDLTSYINGLYYNYYGNYNQGSTVAETYASAIDTWNEKMSTFKVCQPCRAYNLFAENGSSHSRDRRRLDGDENDGDGEEQERFNCYDDAGYTNVNQCYKFETHTSMAVADKDNLGMASSQGSILRIKAYGHKYGKGGYVSPMSQAEMNTYITLAALTAIFLFGMVLIFVERRGKLVQQRKRAVGPKSMKESLCTDDASRNTKGANGDNVWSIKDVKTFINSSNSDDSDGICLDIEVEMGSVCSETTDTSNITTMSVRKKLHKETIKKILHQYSAIYHKNDLGSKASSDNAYVPPSAIIAERPDLESTSPREHAEVQSSYEAVPIIESTSGADIDPTFSADSTSAMLVDLGLVKRSVQSKLAPRGGRVVSSASPVVKRLKELERGEPKETNVDDLDSKSNADVDLSSETTGLAESTPLPTDMTLASQPIEIVEPEQDVTAGETSDCVSLQQLPAPAEPVNGEPSEISVVESNSSNEVDQSSEHNAASEEAGLTADSSQTQSCYMESVGASDAVGSNITLSDSGESGFIGDIVANMSSGATLAEEKNEFIEMGEPTHPTQITDDSLCGNGKEADPETEYACGYSDNDLTESYNRLQDKMNKKGQENDDDEGDNHGSVLGPSKNSVKLNKDIAQNGDIHENTVKDSEPPIP